MPHADSSGLTPAYLAEDDAAGDQQWTDGHDDERELPAEHESQHEAGDGAGEPLEEVAQLVTHAFLNLVDVTAKTEMTSKMRPPSMLPDSSYNAAITLQCSDRSIQVTTS